jgi:hypothetical protein
MPQVRQRHGLTFLKEIDDGRWLDGSEIEGEDCFSRIEAIFRHCRWQRKNGRTMSEATRRDYGNHIFRCFRDVREAGHKIEKPWNLETRHIEALCRVWSQRKLGPSVIQTRLTALSWFCAVMGRPGLVRGTHDYDHCFERSVVRSQIAERDRSPEGQGVSREDVVSRAMAEDATFGHLVLLQLALGLRKREAIRAMPWVHDGGDVWRLPPNSGGAKGGRARLIFLNQGTWQREAIDRVKAYVRQRDQRKRSTLGWSSERAPTLAKRGLQYDLERYDAHAKRAGFTKDDLGFTGHGLRHSFAKAEIAERGFIPTVTRRDGIVAAVIGFVKAQPLTPVQREAERLAREYVSRQLGHSRVSVTSAYLGRMGASQLQRADALSQNVLERSLLVDGIREVVQAYREAYPSDTEVVLAGRLVEFFEHQPAFRVVEEGGVKLAEPLTRPEREALRSYVEELRRLAETRIC